MTEHELAQLRAAMDALNLQLRDLLQQRAQLALRIGACKRAAGRAAADPAREAAMLAAVSRAPGPGFATDALQRIFAAVFAESRALLEHAAR